MSGLEDNSEVETCGPSRAFRNAWTRVTALRLVPQLMPRLLLDKSRDRVLCLFEAFEEEIARVGSEPKFVLFHVISPHPPFLFLADGRSQSLVDTHVRDWNPRSAYVDQLQYINRRISPILKRITRGDENETLVLLHADHGPASLQTKDWATVEPNFVRERMPILLATRGQSTRQGIDKPESRHLESPLAAASWLAEIAL